MTHEHEFNKLPTEYKAFMHVRLSTLRCGVTNDHRVVLILSKTQVRTELISVAYADSTWDQIISALNTFELFASQTCTPVIWPFYEQVICSFIYWSTFSRKLSLSTINFVHVELEINSWAQKPRFLSFQKLCAKLKFAGAQNLAFYSNVSKANKKVFTMPLIRMLGYEIAKCDWSVHSKSL